MSAANEHYLAYMVSIDNLDAGLRDIDKISCPVRDQDRSFRGFNLFQEQDYQLFTTTARGEWNISGIRAMNLRTYMLDLS